MPNAKITDLTPYTTQHNDDLFVVVDVHDTSMASTGTDKKITFSQVLSTATGGITGLRGDITTNQQTGASPAFFFGQTNTITPSITGTINDWSPFGYLTAGVPTSNVLRTFIGSGDAKLTGLVPPSNPDGFIVTLENRYVSPGVLQLLANNNTSTSGNWLGLQTDVFVYPGESIQLQYDNTNHTWREFAFHKDYRVDLWGSAFDGSSTGIISTTLSRDMFYNDLVVPAGSVITMQGFKIFVAGTLDISNASAGSFIWNGSTGSNGGVATGGAGGVSTAGTNTTLGNSEAGALGGNGGVNAGSTGASSTGRVTFNGVTGAAGGAGGSSSGAAGAAGAGVTNTIANPPYGFMTGLVYQANAVVNFVSAGVGGSSGGGGGGDSVTSGGGGGGGGACGGFALISARKIYRGSNSASGIFAVHGGVGGNGGTPVAGTTAGGGGGAGGQGGTFLLYHGGLFGNTIPKAIDISGGTGGNGGSAHGSANAGNGGRSGPGGTALVFDAKIGTLSLTLGTIGNAAVGSTGGVSTPTLVDL